MAHEHSQRIGLVCAPSGVEVVHEVAGEVARPAVVIAGLRAHRGEALAQPPLPLCVAALPDERRAKLSAERVLRPPQRKLRRKDLPRVVENRLGLGEQRRGAPAHEGGVLQAAGADDTLTSWIN